MWNALRLKILELRNKFVPFETLTGKPNCEAKGSITVDKATQEAIREKEKSHRIWMLANRTGPNDEVRCKYTKARNKVNALLRKGKRRFEREIALKAKSNPKAFWMHTRRY